MATSLIPTSSAFPTRCKMKRTCSASTPTCPAEISSNDSGKMHSPVAAKANEFFFVSVWCVPKISVTLRDLQVEWLENVAPLYMVVSDTVTYKVRPFSFLQRIGFAKKAFERGSRFSLLSGKLNETD